MKKILVTGAGGFVGSRVMQQWAGRYDLCTFPKGFLTVAGEDAVWQAVLQQRPDVILHTAAISDTGYCADHPEQAYRANVELPVWLARAAAETGAKLVFVTPSHQFPLGIVMPVNRRLQLLNWAYEEAGRYIIEDDYDSEFRYQGKPIPALQGMDTQGRVIYMGTLSKAIAPSIRIGYVVLPPKLCEVYHTQASFLATTVSRIDQEILRRFIAEGYFERHLNRMRSVYRGKHDGILELLSPWKDCICDGYSAGVHLLLKFPAEKYRESELVRKAAEAGIVVYPLSAYYITGKPEQPTILLGYARLTDEEMKQGIQVLQDTWQMHND